LSDSFLEQRKAEFMKNPAICESFPIQLEHGFSLSCFDFSCGRCNQPLPNEDIRGKVIRWGGNRVNIVGDGLCQSCLLIIRFDVRINQPTKGGEIDTIYRCPTTHKWRRMALVKKNKVTLLERLRIFIEDIFNPPR